MRLALGWRILLYLGLVILVLAVAGLLGANALGQAGSVGAMLAAALLAGWTLLAPEGVGPGALGFGLRVGAGRELALGTALGVLVLLPVLGILLAAGGLAFSAQGGDATAWLGRGLGSLGFLAFAAAAEEALVRGYPLQALARAWGPGWALAVTSAVFGAFHLGNPSVDWLGAVNVAAAGVFLGVLVLRTGSLWWATGAHLGWNWGQAFLADLPVSGYDVVDTPFWDGALSGAPWFAGGGFGVEGSVLTALVMAAAAWMCWRSDRLEPEAPRWWKDDDTRTGTKESAA